MAMYCGMLIAQLLLASERTATTVAGMFMVPMAMLGGCFFPLESMPENLLKYARATPNGWMLVRLKSILAGAVPSGEMGRDFALLLAAILLLFVFARWMMERRFVA